VNETAAGNDPACGAFPGDPFYPDGMTTPAGGVLVARNANVNLHADQDSDDFGCDASFDPDGDPLTYSWRCVPSTEAGSQTTLPCPVLNGAGTDIASFNSGNSAGLLEFELTVSDGVHPDVLDRVLVRVSANLPPVADATAGLDPNGLDPPLGQDPDCGNADFYSNDYAVAYGSTVYLRSERDSSDVDCVPSADPENCPAGDAGGCLTYSWRCVPSTEAGSQTTLDCSSLALNNAGTAVANFFAGNTDGVLEFELSVDDGTNPAVTDTVLVTVNSTGNRRPVADAGPDQVVVPAAVVGLDGRDSYDLDTCPFGDPAGTCLQYSWVCNLAGSPIAVNNDSTATPSFTAGNDGDVYNCTLTVSDGMLSDIDQVRVTVSDSAPADSLQILSFALDPQDVLVPQAGSQQVNAGVVVKNLGSGSVAARVAITVFDPSGNPMPVGVVESTKFVGPAPVVFDQSDGLLFNVDQTWLPGIYTVHAKVYDSAAALHDSRTKYMTVSFAGAVPVPETSLVLVALVAAIVLFVLRKKK
jgi:hypothetical protein